MNVTKTGDMYKASRIAGPKHNYLGLVLTGDVRDASTVVERTLKDEVPPRCIDKERLVAAVNEGVQKGNRDHGSTFHVEVIEFVPSDTPDYEAYVAMAKAIVSAAAVADV